MNAMRVLMTADTVGGVWTYALELAGALAGHGVRIALATMGAPPSEAQRAEVRSLPNVVLFDSTYKLEWMDDPWDDVQRAGEWLLDLESDIQPDVVHLNGYAHGALPWRAPCLMVGHSCVLSWWEAVKGETAPASWDRYRREVRRGLNSAELVVAPTHAMLDALARHYGPLGPTRVIANARDAKLFHPAPKRPIILSAARLWDEAKNVRALCAAADRLPWPVYVAGDNRGPDGQAVRLAGVNFLGKLSAGELSPWLAQSAIFALPARYEPFGLSTLEAALCGCALVLGDIASLREVWGDAAVYVPPDDVDALVAAVTRLCGYAPERIDMSLRAQRRAMHYMPGRFAREYLEVYRQLAGMPGVEVRPAVSVVQPGA